MWQSRRMLLLFSAEIALIMFVSSSCNTCVVVSSYILHVCFCVFLIYFTFVLLFVSFFCHQVGMLCTTPTDEHVSVRTSD